MKTLFALAALTFSVGAFAACPDLSGSWKCTTASGHSYDLKIAQNDIANGEHYDITHSCHKTMGLDADGTAHTSTNDYGTMTVTGTCNADSSLHVVVDAASTDHSKMYSEDMTIVKSDDNTVKTTGTAKETNAGHETDKTIDTTCTRATTR